MFPPAQVNPSWVFFPNPFGKDITPSATNYSSCSAWSVPQNLSEQNTNKQQTLFKKSTALNHKKKENNNRFPKKLCNTQQKKTKQTTTQETKRTPTTKPTPRPGHLYAFRLGDRCGVSDGSRFELRKSGAPRGELLELFFCSFQRAFLKQTSFVQSNFQLFGSIEVFFLGFWKANPSLQSYFLHCR